VAHPSPIIINSFLYTLRVATMGLFLLFYQLLPPTDEISLKLSSVNLPFFFHWSPQFLFISLTPWRLRRSPERSRTTSGLNLTVFFHQSQGFCETLPRPTLVFCPGVDIRPRGSLASSSTSLMSFVFYGRHRPLTVIFSPFLGSGRALYRQLLFPLLRLSFSSFSPPHSPLFSPLI